jgi:mRNA-degrading endonuclease toxin of MazEF toxin-antitoxin module
MLKRLVPGAVAWAPDLFHDDDPTLAQGGARPWLVISNDSYPGQKGGTQYVCCALTSNLARHDSMVPLEPADWENGGGGKPRQIDAETVQVVKHRWCTTYLGRVKYAKVRESRKLIAGWIV